MDLSDDDIVFAAFREEVVPGTWIAVASPQAHLEDRLRVFWAGTCPWCDARCLIGHMPTRRADIGLDFALEVSDAVLDLESDRVVFVTQLGGRTVEVEDLDAGTRGRVPRARLQPVMPYGCHAAPECPAFAAEFERRPIRQFLAACQRRAGMPPLQ